MKELNQQFINLITGLNRAIPIYETAVRNLPHKIAPVTAEFTRLIQSNTPDPVKL